MSKHEEHSARNALLIVLVVIKSGFGVSIQNNVGVDFFPGLVSQIFPQLLLNINYREDMNIHLNKSIFS